MKRIVEWVLPEDEDVLQAISLVSAPAIKSNFLLFNEQTLEFKAILDRREIIGAAMIPDRLIRRTTATGELYEGFFSKETVRKAAQSLFKSDRIKAINLEHSFTIKDDNSYVFESWIVESPECDKSTHLGFNMPAGTWMVGIKIDSDELWEQFIKSGDVQGFSVEIKAIEREVDTYTEIQNILSKDIAAEAQYEELKRLLGA